MKTFIVIPTYNEKDNIGPLLTAIFNLKIPNLSVIVVDDNSPDGTADEAQKISGQYPIHLIKRKTKAGLGSAYVAGFKKALSLDADIIFEMDADFSHNPQDIPRLIEALNTADLAIGSRKINHGQIVGWGWWRQFMSNGAMRFGRFFLGLKTHDITAGFRAFKRNVLLALNLDKIKSNGYAFQEEILFLTEKKGFKIKEVPVVFVDRQKGRSKLSKKDIIEFFLTIFKLRFVRRMLQL